MARRCSAREESGRIAPRTRGVRVVARRGSHLRPGALVRGASGLSGLHQPDRSHAAGWRALDPLLRHARGASRLPHVVQGCDVDRVEKAEGREQNRLRPALCRRVQRRPADDHRRVAAHRSGEESDDARPRRHLHEAVDHHVMMNRAVVALLATLSGTAGAQLPVDSALAAFIGRIRAVDNHSHVNTAVPRDSEFDALPLDGLLPSPTPVRLRPDNPELIGVYRTLYDYPYADLSDAHLTELRATMARVQRERGTSFPEWLLDKAGIEVMLANRIAMGPGLAPPRFRWVSYVDALMLPLATTAERAATPDYAALYPLEDRLLRRYMKDLGLARLPATLDAYLRTVVTPTLERQRREGCVAVKFEIAYLRALDFDAASRAAANVTYARYVAGGAPPRGEYRNLENFLFRYIARESGRLGM